MNQEPEEDRTQVFVPLVEGTMVSHFRLVRRIGAGGMGEVYLADDEQLGRRVALKFLPSQMANDVDLKNRFIREARAAAKLNHPNIITIHEVGEFNGRPYFAMEYVEGKSLHDIAHEGSYKMSDLLALATQVAEGLRRAHEQGIIHRDIKSANIIVGADGRARILDFGLAAVRGSEKLTRDGSTLGTVAYMSPEQVRGETIDTRSDLFSLGVVLYELITGRTPFRRDSDAAIMNAISSETAEPLARYKANVPPALQQMIEKALQKDPSTRYQTAADFVADLKRIQAETSSPSVPAMPSSKPILAVLPFDNTGSTEREYFADGITDEVIARLARLREIGVISQSSAAQYKKSPKRPREIGQELGCGYLLQGSIRWDESSQPVRMRINAKLTRVSDETYLWAETYDRVLDQIFAVQSEIADQVAKAMGVTLTSSRAADSSSGVTTNLDAYDLYLRAREYFPAFVDTVSLRRAAELLRQSLELDPEFAVACAVLGWCEAATYFLADRSGQHLVESKNFIERAFRIAPNLFEAHVAMGFHQYWGHLDYPGALEHFDKAMAIRPNDAEVISAIGMVERRQGKFEESIRRVDLAIRLNPRNQLNMINQAQSFVLTGRYDEAVAMAERAVGLKPDGTYGIKTLAHTVACKEGTFQAGARIINQAKQKFSPMSAGTNYPDILLYLFLHHGDAQKALDNLELTFQGFDTLQFLQIRLTLSQLAGRKDMERAYAEGIICAGESRLLRDKEDIFTLCQLAIAYISLGMPDRARELAGQVTSTRTFALDPLGRDISLLYLVEICARMDEIDKALDFLAEERSGASWFSPQLIVEIPYWSVLRENPRFWSILGLPQPG
jgi:serine/threonine protein kinase